MRIIALMNLDVFRLSMGWALESLGHEVYYMEDLTEQTLDLAVQTFKPDMLLDMGWDVWHCIYTNDNQLASRREIKERYDLFHVYFAEEDRIHFDIWSSKYSSLLRPDFVLTRGKSCVSLYNSMGFPSAYLDVGCNPGFQRPVPAAYAFTCDVSVIVNGQFSWDIFRKKSIQDLVIPLFDQPYDTRIWGRDWETVSSYYGKEPRPGMLRGVLPYHFTPAAYNSAKINISVQSVEDQLSNRTYDIMSAGGFLLTSDTLAIRERMVPGVHCEVTSSPEETLEKIAFYLNNDSARERIAQNGMQLAHEQFSYQNTLPKVWPMIMTEFKKKQSKGGEAV